MALEIRLDARHSQVELVSRDKNSLVINVDGKLHEVDILMVEDGTYSLLLNGKSYLVQLTEGDVAKKYNVETELHTFDLEIIDAETRYLQSRKRNEIEDEGNHISSPMPGKVIKIPVKIGDKVDVGQTLIIVAAMKMESEYKAGKAGVIKEILVNEGDIIEGNQLLITIE